MRTALAVIAAILLMALGWAMGADVWVCFGIAEETPTRCFVL